MRYRLQFLVIAAFAAGTATPSELGVVSGHIYAETGTRAVAGASVYLESLDRPNPGRPLLARTNEEGEFSIEAQPGKYAVHAFKPDEGYPDIVFAFNLPTDQKLREIKVAAGQHLAAVDVRLGPKPAVLMFNVTDAKTGVPLSSVDYEMCQLHRPDRCLRAGASGRTEFSAPATEITIQVGAHGYSTYKYIENGRAFFAPSPGERKEVAISLVPSR